MELNAQLPMAPSGWGTREALSYALPYLWPAHYEATVRRFEQAGPGEGDAFLRRSGVRWCVLPRLRHAYSEQSVWRIVADVDDWNMRVYDCHPDAWTATLTAFRPRLRAPTAFTGPSGCRLDIMWSTSPTGRATSISVSRSPWRP